METGTCRHSKWVRVDTRMVEVESGQDCLGL